MSENEDELFDWKRIQIDRKRLEAMITGKPVQGTSISLPNANEFFDKVQSLSGARILWPRELKIGAKTKKDPYVKLNGTTEQIESARQLISATLQRKRDRVTLKMLIPHESHSHIIGRGGKGSKRIMQLTACHIHFPDMKQHQSADEPGRVCEKSDQVSITGGVEQVENARRLLREKSLVEISFELPWFGMTPPLLPTLLPEITASMYLHASKWTVKLRCAAQDVEHLKQSLASLSQALFPNQGWIPKTRSEIRSSSLTASSELFDRLYKLAESENTTVQFYAMESLFVLEGSVGGVINTRDFILRHTLVTLSFDCPSESLVRVSHLMSVEKDHDLQARIKKKFNVQNGEISIVVLRAREAEMTRLYSARERILGLEQSELHRAASEARELPSQALPLAEHSLAPKKSPFYSIDQFSQQVLPISEASLSFTVTEEASQHFLSGGNSASRQLLTGGNSASQHFLTGSNSASQHLILGGNSASQHLCTTDIISMQYASEAAVTAFAASLKLESSSSTDASCSSRSPNPTDSPIAHSLLKGAKEINKNTSLWKNELSPLSREELLLRANIAIFEPSFEHPRYPTDSWSGLGFSASLPADLIRAGMASKSKQKKDNHYLRSSHTDEDLDTHIESYYNGRICADSDQTPPPKAFPLETSRQGLASVMEEEELLEPDHLSVNMNASTVDFARKQRIPTKKNSNFSMSSSCLESAAAMNQSISWDIDVFVDPAMVLVQLGCQEYLPQFRAQDIDMEALLLSDEHNLKEIGVATVGARKKIANAILSQF